MLVLFFLCENSDYEQELIAHHCEPALENDSNTACVDSNAISVQHKIISNAEVNVSEPLSQLHHTNALSQN